MEEKMYADEETARLKGRQFADGPAVKIWLSGKL